MDTPQKGPVSVDQIKAQTKFSIKELQDTISEQVILEYVRQHIKVDFDSRVYDNEVTVTVYLKDKYVYSNIFGV